MGTASRSLLLFTCFALAGCGSEAAPEPAEPEAVETLLIATDLERCRAADRDPVWVSAANWSGAVDGISCNAAGRFITKHVFQDFHRSQSRSEFVERSIRTSDPGSFRSDGFDCASFPLPDGMGWHLICASGPKRISFYFTP